MKRFGFTYSATFLCALVLCLGACAKAPQMTADPQNPYPSKNPPKIGDMVHMPTGIALDTRQMLNIATDARVVYVGETHDNPASHRLQETVLAAMDERYPGKLALGMEMFVPSQQPVLDRWVAGELREKEFLKLSNWYGNWRMDFDYYRGLLELARDRKIPVIALNAEKDLIKLVSKNKPEELSPEDRARLPELDFSDPYQRSVTEAIFGGHDHGNGMMDGFVRVQTLWDESMAQSVAEYLKSPRGQDRRMVVVAGDNHIRYGFGIPRRAFRRLPSSYVTIGTRELDIPADKQDRLMDVTLPQNPMVPFDILAYTAYEDLGKQEVKLGIMLNDEDGKVRVEGVVPDSNAARAGIEKGDIILGLDEQPVYESFDIIYTVKQKKPGNKSMVKVNRDNQVLDIPVEYQLSKPAEHHGKK